VRDRTHFYEKLAWQNWPKLGQLKSSHFFRAKVRHISFFLVKKWPIQWALLSCLLRIFHISPSLCLFPLDSLFSSLPLSSLFRLSLLTLNRLFALSSFLFCPFLIFPFLFCPFHKFLSAPLLFLFTSVPRPFLSYLQLYLFCQQAERRGAWKFSAIGTTQQGGQFLLFLCRLISANRGPMRPIHLSWQLSADIVQHVRGVWNARAIRLNTKKWHIVSIFLLRKNERYFKNVLLVRGQCCVWRSR
jgi:hypothetical protein